MSMEIILPVLNKLLKIIIVLKRQVVVKRRAVLGRVKYICLRDYAASVGVRDRQSQQTAEGRSQVQHMGYIRV
jgi:hypothetical protein